MTQMYRIGLIFLMVFVASFHSAAQGQKHQFKGAVVDQDSGQPIEFASISIKDKVSNKIVAGATADVNGRFDFEVAPANFYVEISFIGYQSIQKKSLDLDQKIIDLGVIKLSQDSRQLDDVIVRGEKSSTEFKLDKRVFNVGQDLASAGLSSLEVLNNVPSVNVTIEGEISLRGDAGVQILINGKPSVLADGQGNALGSITAEMIDRIEVITNPSAKYDAEGTAGIINIVIKKEERKGTNGSISINTGAPHNHSVGLSLNRRSEKFNLFSQIGAGYRENPVHIKNVNVDHESLTTLRAEGTGYRNENFYNLNLGTDYYFNKFNVLTISGNFAYEIEDQPSATSFSQTENGDQPSDWERTEVTEATNPKYRYELNFKREFKDNPKEHTLQFSALGNFFGKKLDSDFENESSSAVTQQRTNSDFREGKYTFKLDYAKPLSEVVAIETGAQYLITDVNNDYAVSNLTEGNWVENDGLTNVFDYELKVLGLYATTSYEGDKWGVKGGLRMENTNLYTYLETSNLGNTQVFTDFFPSAHLSYKLNKTSSLQAGYSRRIYRPRLWDLNPFFNVRNEFNIRTGNPNLLPQYTDSYEVSSVMELKKASVSMSVYHKYTTDKIERVSVSSGGNKNTTQPYNVGTNRSTGFELNAKYSPLRKVTFNTDVNIFYFEREGQFESQIFDFSDSRWTAKLNTKFKLPAKFDVELTGRYQSSFETVQSTISEVVFMDIGLRKKIMDGKGIISGSIRDVFASRRRESTADLEEFYLYQESYRGRFITLGFSYAFGKGEAMQYGGSRRR